MRQCILCVMKDIKYLISDILASEYTQKTLAEEVAKRSRQNCTQPTVARMGNGKIKNPRWQYVYALMSIHKELSVKP